MYVHIYNIICFHRVFAFMRVCVDSFSLYCVPSLLCCTKWHAVFRFTARYVERSKVTAES